MLWAVSSGSVAKILCSSSWEEFLNKVGMGGWNTPVSPGHTQAKGSWCTVHGSFIIRWGQPYTCFFNIPVSTSTWGAEISGFLEEQEEWFSGAPWCPPSSLSSPSPRLPVSLLTWIKSSSLSSVSSVHGDWNFSFETSDSSFLISYLKSPSLTMRLETDPGETSGGLSSDDQMQKWAHEWSGLPWRTCPLWGGRGYIMLSFPVAKS